MSEVVYLKQQEYQKMLALLERVVKLDESEYEFDDVAWYNFIADVKTLLKEAKEVKG